MKFFSGKNTPYTKEKAVETALLENYNRYYRLAYSYVHNNADAGDIVQNGAYRAIRNSSALRQTDYAATWIYRIMLHEIFRFCQAQQKAALPVEELPETAKTEDSFSDIDLHQALDSLNEKDRAVILLRFFEDRTLEEIAEILQENLSTVKSRLYRSLKKLRLQLENPVL